MTQSDSVTVNFPCSLILNPSGNLSVSDSTKKTLNSSLLPRSRHWPSRVRLDVTPPPLRPLLCLPTLLSASSSLQTLPTWGVTDEQVSSLESPWYSTEEWKWVILGQSAMRRSVEPRRETNYTLLTQCLVSESKGAADWWKKGNEIWIKKPGLGFLYAGILQWQQGQMLLHLSVFFVSLLAVYA